MRRLLRWLVNGLGKALCLLSLVACLGVGWLWWRGGRAKSEVDPAIMEPIVSVEAAALRMEVEVFSSQGWLSLRLVRRWPGAAGVRELEGADALASLLFDMPAPGNPRVRVRRARTIAGVRFESGECPAYGEEDDPPDPLPFWAIEGVPEGLAVSVFAAPPLLWVARRSGRSWVRRRRRRLGLCLRCGYDLRGNTSGKCSECGQKIEEVTAERRVTA